MKAFSDFGIDLPSGRGPEVDTTCPKCSPTRRKKYAKCLSVNTDLSLWLCHHCGWNGTLKDGEGQRYDTPRHAYVKPKIHRLTPLPEKVIAWFGTRGIPESVLAQARVGWGQMYFSELEDHAWAIQFPYYRAGELINIKYRALPKSFRMATGAERILYGVDDIAGNRTLVWVEGEMDKLSMEVAGVTACVSVPDGAPDAKSKHYESKFSFLESAEDLLAEVDEHILAVDNDANGRRLEEELARRLGVEKCRRVSWPEGCKDANEVLVRYGPDRIAACVGAAESYPVEGLMEVKTIERLAWDLYEHGLTPGVSTGWPKVDEKYTVKPGQLTVVSGIPAHGKTSWVQALATNLARLHGWRFAVFSPEDAPLERLVNVMAQRWAGETVMSAYGPRMSPERFTRALAWLQDHFTFLQPEDTQAESLEAILTLADIAVLRYGIRGLIIDPWNEIEHERPRELTESEYIGKALRRIRRWARAHAVHVWVIVHPTKLYKKDEASYPVPTLYDCTGCYSDDTEVLTKRGWLPHSEIVLNDDVACFDLETSTMTYRKPSQVIKKLYDGEIHHFKGYGYDLLVTPEHRMVIEPQWSEPNGRQHITHMGRPVTWIKNQWSFCNAADLPTSSFSVPLAGLLLDQPTEVISENLARLAGWYVSEGSGIRGGGVSIAQGVGDKADQIEALLTAMCIPFMVRRSMPGGKGGTILMKSFYIGIRQSRTLVTWLRQECGVGSAQKRIPSGLFASAPSAKRAFLESYLAGDGCPGANGTFRAYTTSVILRDQLQRLSLELSLPSSWHERSPVSPNHQVSWQVNFGRLKRVKTAMRTARNRTIEHYQGLVWCLTVPTGAYFVRRNGKALACGNSANWRNKADNGIIIYRPSTDNHDAVEIHIQKIKFLEVGKPGKVDMIYHKSTGRFSEISL